MLSGLNPYICIHRGNAFLLIIKDKNPPGFFFPCTCQFPCIYFPREGERSFQGGMFMKAAVKLEVSAPTTKPFPAALVVIEPQK